MIELRRKDKPKTPTETALLNIPSLMDTAMNLPDPYLFQAN
jgi:hypothetical protein